MIRRILVSEKNELTISIPDELLGKKLELLLFPIPEEDVSEQDDEESIPNKDTFLSYLQNSGFGAHKNATSADEDSVRK